MAFVCMHLDSSLDRQPGQPHRTRLMSHECACGHTSTCSKVTMMLQTGYDYKHTSMIDRMPLAQINASCMATIME